ncbi:putative bifunctional diguanylate cyclase/phosphodiesterase [Bowmanella dokdonensis]|uniref:Bifunctional diguanylate cyclase/phosphodiesterase n=1 Tax=Bowmanella dokdonensis TaxID=751969 RepID=A0A939IQZ1_9ALTE|nr:bifunctional diguanylate cyclase/phosphodiesterase [Bowmanella dokdonensis]MBN7825569.1 bifunctional diguanylate cyclase/phosphodiesterase [Bowmanella dokdonensis]
MRKVLKSAGLIALIYTLLGASWILFSDLAVERFVSDHDLQRQVQTYKGWAYVLVNATLLFLLISRALSYFDKATQRDPLTKLYRHYQFTGYLKEMLSRQLPAGRQVILLYLDIDKFKSINEKLGYQGADIFLQSFSDRLRSHYQADTLMARLGADQFALAKPLGGSGDDYEAEGHYLQQLFAEGAAEAGLDIGCSIGVALAPEDGRNARELLSAAFIALKNGKQEQPGTIQLYNRNMSRDENERQAMLTDLREAIAGRRLSLVYQPQFDSFSQELTGCEVLLRWHCPKRSFVSPAEFIPLAEANNLMSAISAFVVEQASLELQQSGLLGQQVQRVSVNVSAMEFSNPALMENLLTRLRANESLYPYLQLEITETAALSDLGGSVKLLAELRRQGLKFSIDDFGTGYSSLMMLKELPIDEIKIDRAFIHDMLDQPKAIAIIETLASVARKLGISVVAEGVETEEQLQRLKDCGCHEVQGYLLARPMKIAEFVTFLQRGSPSGTGRRRSDATADKVL